MNQDGPRELGLRERKKRKTRQAIQQQALLLFREQGYHQTTVEQIAEAAEVSPSTFFRYFPTKEDVVLNDEYDSQIIEAFYNQPADINTVRALRNAMAVVFGQMSEEEQQAQMERARLLMNVPELRASFFNNLAEGIDLIAKAVAERMHRGPEDFAVRTLAGALMGVGISVSFFWMEHPQLNIMEILDEAFRYIESGFPLNE